MKPLLGLNLPLMYNVFFAALFPPLRKISYLMEQPNLYNSKAFQVLMSFPSQWIGTRGPYDFPDRTEPHRNIILDTRRTKKFSNMFPKLCGVKKEHSVLIYAEVFASKGCFHLTQLSSLFFPRLLILSRSLLQTAKFDLNFIWLNRQHNFFDRQVLRFPH